MSVALSIQYEKHMRRRVLSCVPVRFYHVYPQYPINRSIFGKKKRVIEQKNVFDFLCDFCPKYFRNSANLSKN